MPDRRTRRGPHPDDARCFAAEHVPRLRQAAADLSWLRGRGYSARAALKLVGDRHQLRDRQRRALQRCAASEAACRSRAARRVPIEGLAGEQVAVDGYNVLLTLEAALSGGVVLLARDGAVRDLAGLSGHYRKLEVTRPALGLLMETLEAASCAGVRCLFDSPVSNSGRLKTLVEDLTASATVPWRVELCRQTDRALKESAAVVATADSAILDRCARWVNLARHVVETRVPEAWVLDLASPEP